MKGKRNVNMSTDVCTAEASSRKIRQHGHFSSAVK
jgi:hypothetical protein